MKSYLYKIECLTNLHVGSGDINFSIVDNEVEKDPVTGYPTINATGVKGAIRDYYESKGKSDTDLIFGSAGDSDTMKPGLFKFFNAEFLYRPMRTSGSVPYVQVTSCKAVNDYISKSKAFGFDLGVEKINEVTFGDFAFATNDKRVNNVEGDKTNNSLTTDKDVETVLGLSEYAFAKSFDNYDLPVIARNSLDDNGISKNLWYEEFVPHGSAFYLIVLTPNDYGKERMLEVIEDGAIIQFGANSSVGNGFCKLSFVKEGEC